MFDSMKRFFSRNRRKFIIVGVAVGGTYLVARYAKQKLVELQESSTKEFIEKTRRVQHFESTERTCNQAIVSLTANVSDEILQILNPEIILEKLRTNPEDKLQLWDNLKIMAFTRLTTLIYATTILVVTLRVQLNVLGGYLYKDTKSDDTKISNELRQSYLSLVQNFLHSGLRDMTKLIESKVRLVLEAYPLTKKLSLSDIEQVFWSIQMAVNSDPTEPNSNLTRYVFPSTIDDSNKTLKKMYDETLDILESDDVAALCANCISRGFSIAVDTIAESFSETNKTPNQITANGKSALEAKPTSGDVVNINNMELSLAKIIPILNNITAVNQENNNSRPSLTSSLVTFYLIAEKIKTLGTNVYEVFSV